MANNKTMMHTVSLTNLINWSVRYLLENTFSYKEDYKLVSIGDFLTRNDNLISVEDDVDYKRVTVRINNNGVYLRDVVSGKYIGTKKQFVVSGGQFIMSKIDARNGAFGIIPDELNGAIVTNDFPTFAVNEKEINTQFLVLITTTEKFISFAQSCSSGTTNRQRIDLDSFLNVKIPLPSLTEQNRIVKSYNDKIANAERLQAKAEQLEEDIENYFFESLDVEKNKFSESKKGLRFINFSKLSKWALSSLQQNTYDFATSKYELLSVADLILFIKGGKTPSKSRKDFWNGDVNWTSPKDFNGQFIDRSEDQITESAVDEATMEVFPVGTFLSVFRSGILRHSFPTAIIRCETTINQDLKAYKLNEEVINNLYYLYFTQVFKQYILAKSSKKSVTVESVNTNEFLDLRIPVPPLKVQNEIANHISDLKEKIKVLRNQAEQNKESAIKEFEREIFN